MFTAEFYRYLILGAAVTITLIFVVYSRSKKRHTLPLPPGPRGSWVEGVALQLPKSEPWCTYAGWSAQYNSPIISFRVYNRRLMVLNSAVAADALLTRRSAIYSERPHSTMYNVICGRGKSVFNINASDPLHKRYRTLIQGELGPNGTRRYMGLIEEEAKNLARALLRSFDGRDKAEPGVGAFVKDVERNAVGVILKMAFGYTVKENADASGEGGRDAGDPFLRASAEAAKISGWAMQPGRWLVDYIPILRFVPAWMPGAGWKRQGLAWRDRLLYLADIPHAWAKQQMETGTYEESFTSRLLSRRSGNNGRSTAPASSFPSSPPGSWSSCPSPIPSFTVLPHSEVEHLQGEDEDVVKWCAAGLYAGAGDTTVSAIVSFILLMALYPRVQEKARREIFEAQAGGGRVDVHRLEYLGAIMKEVLRFAPVGNLALPHRVSQHDVYEGYHIPKGSTIIANVWAILHDSNMYSEPFTFRPERFMSSGAPGSTKGSAGKGPEPDPKRWAFGFGRRACPGLYFADTTVLCAIYHILAECTISLPRSEASKSNSDIQFTTGNTSHIKPFPIVIRPIPKPRDQ